jgi:hypothetical protein
MGILVYLATSPQIKAANQLTDLGGGLDTTAKCNEYGECE